MVLAKRNRAMGCLCLVFFLIFEMPGCITYKPRPIQEIPFMERAQTQSDGPVKVTASVLSDKESKALFGVSLAQKGIQPVWLKIENNDSRPYIFLQSSLDPNYYSPAEAAYINHISVKKRILGEGLISVLLSPLLLSFPIDYVRAVIANRKMDQVFNETAFINHILMPGESSSGFVFATLDEGVKEVRVRLYADDISKRFDFFINVPGIRADHLTKEFSDRYPEEAVRDYDPDGLKKALAEIPCCTTNEKGTRRGDPLNLVVIGDLDEILAAFAAAKWDQTETLSFKSAWKMLRAFMSGQNYRYSPVSPLFFKSHPQDVSIQKTRETIKERLHLRLWYTPMRLESKPVWIGTVSRDIGVRFTLKTWYLSTHKIDPNIDDARDYVAANLFERDKISRYGFIQGVGEIAPSAPRENLTGDKYFTDGLRVVAQVSEKRVSLQPFNWPYPLPAGIPDSPKNDDQAG